MWHSDSCYIYPYTKREITTCLRNSRTVFAGDSTVRDVYHALRRKLIPNSASEGEKHSDLTTTAPNGIELQFYWDPWLNRTDIWKTESKDGEPTGTIAKKKASLLVYGAGLWYMRYGGQSGYEDFTTAIDKLSAGRRQNIPAAELSVIRPLNALVIERLRPDRKQAMIPRELRRYNDYLRHKLGGNEEGNNLHFPEYVWQLYLRAPEFAFDGMHYESVVADSELQLYLNERCNKQLFATKPAGKATCCVDYVPIKSKQWAVILLLAVFGAVAYLWRVCVAKSSITNGVISKPVTIPFAKLFDKLFPARQSAADLAILCLSLLYVLLVDRTSYLPKTNKVFSLGGFSLLTLACTLLGSATLKRTQSSSSRDTDFLSRLQTDEWKGWMQLAILVYHYFGASAITPIYAAIRVLVASYLFMTGYGHFVYFYTKKEFGLQRVVSVLVRLNFLSVLLACVMDQDVLFYYFGPLVSWWFLVLYVTMVVGAPRNGNTVFLMTKIGIAAAICYAVIEIPVILETVFGFVNSICATTWNPRETAFRLGLDRYIVFVGMLAAWTKLTIAPRLATSASWNSHKRYALLASVLMLTAYAIFIAFSPNKYWYNAYHPVLSPVAVVSFTIIRNYNISLRSTTSAFFRWVGRNSLELFLVQYHVWLGVDTKGVVGLGFGGMWVGCAVLGLVFFGIAESLSGASGRIVDWAVGKDGPQRLAVALLAVTLWNWL